MTVVVVTGASRGMGALTARRLAEQGCTVFAGARRPAAVAEQLRQEPVGGDLRPLALDVTDDASVASAAQEVEAATGAVDVVVNNAGVAGTWAGPADVGPEDFREVLDVNVLGPVRVTRTFLPLLLRAERPRLVMVSSGMGSFAHQTGDPVYADIAHLPYPASKAALDMLVVQYAKALPQVLVTAVDPGLTATDFTGGAGHTVAEGAAPIIAAALDTVGPSGRFVDADGAAGW